MNKLDFPVADVELTDDIPDPGPSVEQMVDMRMALQRITAALDVRGQKVVTMMAEGYTSAEIAEELGVSQRRAQEIIVEVRRKAGEAL